MSLERPYSDSSSEAPSDAEPSTATLGAGARPRLRDGHPPVLFARGELIASRFRISGLLGSGGGGQVYAALDLLLDQRIALKTIGPEAAGRPGGFDLLRSEVLAARAVTHPNVCRIFDLFRHVVPADGERPEVEIAVMAMELLEGETLARRLRRKGPLPDDEVTPLAHQLAAGLAAAHAAGILHLDLKSANVVLVPAGTAYRAVIADFGLARRSTRGGGPAGSRGGTPGYMAPEQARGEEVTPATDVYAAGCVLHEMVTGRLPTEADDGTRQTSEAPERWHPLLEACLATSLAERPADGAALAAALAEAHALEGVEGTGRRPRRRRWRIAAALLALVFAGFLSSGPYVPAPERSPLSPPPTDSPLASAADRSYARGLRLLLRLEPAGAKRALEETLATEPGHLPARLALSEAWQALGSIDRARAEAERAAAGVGDAAAREVRLWVEGRLLETDRRPAEAADRYRTLLALRPDDLGQLARLVRALVDSDRPEDAERALAPYLPGDARTSTAERDEGSLRVFEAEIADQLGNKEDQLAAARRAGDLARRHGQPGVEAAAALLESCALESLGRVDYGLAAAERALELHTRLEDPNGRLWTLLQLAVVHAEITGETERAEEEHLEALGLAREIGNREAEAAILQNRATDDFQAGDLALAEERFRAAQAIYRDLDQEDGLAIVTGNLALVHFQRDEFRAAEREFERAIELRRRVGPPSAAANLLLNVGVLYVRRGERLRARDAWEECAAIADELGIRLMAALAAINLAHLDLYEGDVAASARRLERDVEPALKAAGRPAVSGEAARVAADVALARDREQEALAALDEALALFEGVGDRSRAAQAHHQLAGVHLRYRRHRLAEEAARRGVEELRAIGQRSGAALGRYHLTRSLLEQGRLEEARTALAELHEDVPEEDAQHLLLAALARGRMALADGETEQAISEIERGLLAVPPGFLVPLRHEADLLLAGAETELGRWLQREARLRRLKAEAERGSFVYFARQASERLANGGPEAERFR